MALVLLRPVALSDLNLECDDISPILSIPFHITTLISGGFVFQVLQNTYSFAGTEVRP